MRGRARYASGWKNVYLAIDTQPVAAKLSLLWSQSSSGVEQGTHKPLVRGSNPLSGTILAFSPEL